MSRGGSADTASASATSIQQPVRFEGSSQAQDPSLFVDSSQRDTFDPTGRAGLPGNIHSCPWLSSAPDLWEPITGQEEQYRMRWHQISRQSVANLLAALTLASPRCNPAISQDQVCYGKPRDSIKQCRSQEEISSEDTYSSLWMCDENDLDLWLQSMTALWCDVDNCGPVC